jgi:ribosome-associated translation inhibitor RaiA
MNIPISIRNEFDRSEALDQHISKRLDSALRMHERYVHRVELRLTDANGPRKGPADKVTLIEIALRPFGEIVAKGESADIYKSVTTATARAKQALSRHAGRLERQARRHVGVRSRFFEDRAGFRPPFRKIEI